MCAFQSAFWQPEPQYAATAHTEHFFSGTPVAPHDQQLFLGRGGSCWEAATKGAAATAANAARAGAAAGAEEEEEEASSDDGTETSANTSMIVA